MTTVSITGHRPEKINDMEWVKQGLKEAYAQVGASLVVQGMAAGVDLTSAGVAWQNNIPFLCAKPFTGHAPRNADRKMYQWAIDHAKEIVDVDPATSYPGPWVYQKRNIWMVDNSDILIAVWDGSSGGTGNAVSYAVSKNKKIFRLDPLKKEILGYQND